MEEGEFHQEIPFRKEVNKGQESLQQPCYTDRSLDKSLGLSILARLGIASPVRIRIGSVLTILILS